MCSINLPDDVFEPGEKKPQKKLGTANGQANSKKRNAPQVGTGWRLGPD